MTTLKPCWLYVGTYTHVEPHAPGACGPGLVTCAFDPRTGRIDQRHVVGDIRNASYLAHDPRHGRLFSTSESVEVENSVQMFQCQPDGSLTRRGVQPSRGRATCHLCILPDGSVGAASYLQSCITVFPVSDGQLQPAHFHYDYRGSGPNAERQEASHAHQVVAAPNQRWFYVVDLGADRIWKHTPDHTEPIGIATPPGYGPRHLAFHPKLPRAYALCELNGHVLTFDWDATTGELRLVADVSSCPDRAHAAGAAIRVHPSGGAIYISDRQEGELVSFRLDDAGVPTVARRVSSGGQVPRDFAIDGSGRWLVVGNQASHNLAVFELDPISGQLANDMPRRYPLDSPACLFFQEG